MKGLARLLVVGAVFVFIGGCPPTDSLTQTGTGDVSDTALNYAGTLDGSVLTESSTAGTDDAQAAQTAGVGADTVVWFTDLEGNALLDANGNEYGTFSVDPDGTFSVPGLPVGVDIMLHVDLDGDGEADLTTIINIPKDASADTGTLDDVIVDPLSTVTGAKLDDLLDEEGVNPEELELSLSGLIGRTRDAYEHLYDDAGIEDTLLLDDIHGLGPAELAQYFDDHVPLQAQRGMRMAASNLRLSTSASVEEIVKAAAQILLEGGFVIADDPNGIDLSFLGDLPNVLTLTFAEYQEYLGMTGPGQESAKGVPLDFAETSPPVPGEPVIYLSELTEPDRNFSMAGDDVEARNSKPMFTESVLTEIAELYKEGKTISLADLHALLVDVDDGLAARLTYTLWTGDPQNPEIEVFQTADGGGILKDTDALYQELAQYADDSGYDAMAAHQASVRDILRDFLEGTIPPSFETMFGGILIERIASADEYAAYIRAKRTHLPFSRSGPSQWFVVADADSWQNPNANPVTVNVETGSGGCVSKVIYDPQGNGKFYLGQGAMIDSGMQVELIRIRNGKYLHDHEGQPQFLDMADTTIFQNVGSETFFEKFSETGENWPGAPALRLPNYDYDPNQAADPETNPPDWEAYVLLTQAGPNGVPVRVNYSNGVATYNAAGAYYLLFDETTPTEGWFALIKETGELLEDPAGSGWANRVLIDPGTVQGITLAPEVFTYVYGVDVPNEGYDPDGAPYYDDINDNGREDTGEPTFAEIPFLGDPQDWRSTWVERYYRRADNHGFPAPDDIDWNAATPKLLNGVVLVPRAFRPRQNGYLFPRPNSALNLLMAFSPPEFFNGTQQLSATTRINPLMAVALIDLAFDQALNIEAIVDWDGPGPMSPHRELVPVWFFVAPVDDPIGLITDTFSQYVQ